MDPTSRNLRLHPGRIGLQGPQERVVSAQASSNPSSPAVPSGADA